MKYVCFEIDIFFVIKHTPIIVVVIALTQGNADIADFELVTR